MSSMLEEIILGSAVSGQADHDQFQMVAANEHWVAGTAAIRGAS
jgi:hypothetical protein